MAKKSVVPTLTVKFLRDFDGHAAGEELVIPASQLIYFEEWNAVEVIEKSPEQPVEVEPK